MQVTGVRSRRVVQFAAVLIVIVTVIGAPSALNLDLLDFKLNSAVVLIYHLISFRGL